MHYFENFKNFKSGELELMSPVSILLGRNGAGKSNVIEAVELLAEIAQGRPLYEISDLGRGSGNAFEIRGGLPSCVRQDGPKRHGLIGALSNNTEFSLAFSALFKSKIVLYKISIDAHSRKICGEDLTWGDDLIFKAIKHSSDEFLTVTYNNFRRGGKKPTEKYSSDKSVLSQYQSIYFAMLIRLKSKEKKSDRGDNRLQECFELVERLKHYLKSSYVFDINPKGMRNYERIGQDMLLRDGSNLSSVLYSLEQGNDKQKNLLGEIFSRINQLPDEPFKKLAFVNTSLNDVMFAFTCMDDSIVDARVLSDGTLRALAILTALETVPETSRIIVEEMDNGIHPSRVKVLLDAIVEVSEKRQLNVLITTHNPATLDALNNEQLKSVYICYFDATDKTSKTLPLSDVPDVDILMERGTLGDLVTKRVLEEHLVPNYSEDRKKKALAWLESME